MLIFLIYNFIFSPFVSFLFCSGLHIPIEGSVRGAVWVMSWESKRTESLGWYHCNSALFLIQQLTQQIDTMKSRGRSITNCKFPVVTFLNSSGDIKSQNHVRKLSAKKKRGWRNFGKMKRVRMSLLGCFIFPQTNLIQYMSGERAWNRVKSSLTEGATHSLWRCF